MTALIRIQSDGVRDLAHDVLDELAEDFSRPSFRAGLATSMLSAAVLARLGARPFFSIVMALMMGAAVERLYGMAEDIHGKLTGDATGEV